MSLDSENTQIASLDSSETDISITLVSNNGESFQINKSYVIPMSNLVSTALSGDNETTLDLDVPTFHLNKIIEWCNHHKGIAPEPILKPLRSAVMKENTNDFDADFIDKFTIIKDLYDFIKYVNYMDIQPLLLLACAKVASLAKGVPIDVIKERLTVKE